MHSKFILLGFIPSKDLIISSNDNMASTQFDGNQFILRHCLTDVVMVHIQGRNYCQRLQKAAKKELYLLLRESEPDFLSVSKKRMTNQKDYEPL